MIVLSFHILLLVSTDSYHLSIDFVVLAGEEWTPCNFHEHVVTLIVHGIPLENDSPCHPPPPLPLIPSECGGNLIWIYSETSAWVCLAVLQLGKWGWMAFTSHPKIHPAASAPARNAEGAGAAGCLFLKKIHRKSECNIFIFGILQYWTVFGSVLYCACRFVIALMFRMAMHYTLVSFCEAIGMRRGMQARKYGNPLSIIVNIK